MAEVDGQVVALALLAGGSWLAWAMMAHALTRNPRGDAVSGLAFAAVTIYARLVHRLTVVGVEHAWPRAVGVGGAVGAGGVGWGPMVVVSNHTGGIDPLLIQVALRGVYIRWVMAAAMRLPALGPSLDWLGVIFVSGRVAGELERPGGMPAPPVVVSGVPRPPTSVRDAARLDRAGLAEAMRHLRAGGCVGIFPEGGIARPSGTLRPFHGGVGWLVARTGARVLPVIVTGTPRARTAWGSFFRRSRARVRVLPPIEYGGKTAEEITGDLQRRYLAATGFRMERGRAGAGGGGGGGGAGGGGAGGGTGGVGGAMGEGAA